MKEERLRYISGALAIGPLIIGLVNLIDICADIYDTWDIIRMASCIMTIIAHACVSCGMFFDRKHIYGAGFGLIAISNLLFGNILGMFAHVFALLNSFRIKQLPLALCIAAAVPAFYLSGSIDGIFDGMLYCLVLIIDYGIGNDAKKKLKKENSLRIEKLSKLEMLRKTGAITDAEFNEKKKELLEE